MSTDTIDSAVELSTGDALLIIDIQRDFLPGGALAITRGDTVVPVLNRYATAFHSRHLPVFATRDWHPADHCSFHKSGGPWPPHCRKADVAGRKASLSHTRPQWGDAGRSDCASP